MTKFTGKTVVCTLLAATVLCNCKLTVNATNMTSMLPAAGLGLELAEGKSVKICRSNQRSPTGRPGGSE